MRRKNETVQFEEDVMVIPANDIAIKEVVMPHAVLVENKASWEARAVRARNHQSDYGEFGATSIFMKDGKPLVVGKEANTNNTGRKTGPAKLERGWLDVLSVALLLKLFPDGHDNLVLGCAHTIDTIAYVDKMAEAVGGKHVVTTPDGRSITYIVRAMIPFDEPAGGLFRFMTRNKTELNYADLSVGDKILVVDIGGKISSMIPAEILSGERVNPLWSAGKPFALGIQDIINSLSMELHSLYPDKFKVRNIPQKILHEALRTNGTVTIYNEVVNVEQAVLNATAPLIDALQGIFVNDMESGLEINHVVITGGGGGLLYEALRSDVFTPLANYTHLADQQNTINLANLRGGEFALAQWMARNSHTVNQGKAKMPLTAVVEDTGNSDLKAKVVGSGYNA